MKIEKNKINDAWIYLRRKIKTYQSWIVTLSRATAVLERPLLRLLPLKSSRWESRNCSKRERNSPSNTRRIVMQRIFTRGNFWIQSASKIKIFSSECLEKTGRRTWRVFYLLCKTTSPYTGLTRQNTDRWSKSNWVRSDIKNKSYIKIIFSEQLFLWHRRSRNHRPSINWWSIPPDVRGRGLSARQLFDPEAIHRPRTLSGIRDKGETWS